MKKVSTAGRVARPLISLTVPTKRVPRSSRSLRRAGVGNAGANLVIQVASYPTC